MCTITTPPTSAEDVFSFCYILLADKMVLYVCLACLTIDQASMVDKSTLRIYVVMTVPLLQIVTFNTFGLGS